MAVRFYDESVCSKFKKWVKDPSMRILSPSETSRLFQMKADQSNDSPVTLPMITISRDSSFEILSTTKKPLTYEGAAQIAVTDDSVQALCGIPIKISYQLDIYTKFFAEADEYARNFIFNIINYPTISIEIPYNNSKIVHNSTMILESSVTDNSDIPERHISGQFYRLSLKFSIDDAYLFSVPFMQNWNVEYEGDVHISTNKGE